MYFHYENDYNPTNDNRKYLMSKAINYVCDFWDISRILTMTYLVDGNYG